MDLTLDRIERSSPPSGPPRPGDRSRHPAALTSAHPKSPPLFATPATHQLPSRREDSVAIARDGSGIQSTGARRLGRGRSLRTVAVLMFNGASMFETSVPMSVFGMNPAGAPTFTVLPVAGETGRMRTSDGVGFDPPHGLEALDRAGIVVLPGWRSPHDAPPPASLEAVRTAHADGALLVSLCMGAFVLAATGLLDGRRAAAHWFHAPTLAARYPSVHVDPSVLFIDDGDIVTSAGTAAGLDACLHVVRRHWGASAATAIARHLVLSPARCGSQAQFVDHHVPVRSEDVELGRVMEYAIAHLQHVDIDALAVRAGLSRRTFDRRFRVQTGVSPLQWLLHQRILRAQNLLERTELTVDAIARQVGLATAVSLRPAFRRIVGVSPQAYRQAFRTVDARAGTDRQCGLTN